MSKNERPRKALRVFVADSSILECQLLVRALQQCRGPIKVVGCATESVEIPKELGKYCPHVAIISADLKDGHGAGAHVTGRA